MMNKPLTLQDWETLSAYLDGQLSEREKGLLETRLRQQPDLQHALAELQQTRTMLRSVSRKRVPHNFTLTRAMVPERRRWFNLAPSFSLASAISTLLLIITFAVQLLPGLRTTQMLAAQAPVSASDTQIAAEVARQMAAAATPAAQDKQSGPVVIWNNATGMGGGGSPSDQPATGMGGGPGGTEVLVPTDQPPQMALAPTLTETPTPRSSVQNQAGQSSGPLILGIRPTQELGSTITDDYSVAYAAPLAPTPTPAPAAPPTDLRGLQVGLLVLALGTGLAAFVIHRQNKL